MRALLLRLVDYYPIEEHNAAGLCSEVTCPEPPTHILRFEAGGVAIVVPVCAAHLEALWRGLHDERDAAPPEVVA
jgi:hypothetical protein